MQYVLQSALLCLIYLFISCIYFIHAVFVLFRVNGVIEKNSSVETNLSQIKCTTEIKKRDKPCKAHA